MHESPDQPDNFYKHYRDKFDLLDNYISRTMDEFRTASNVIFIDAEPDTINEDQYRMPFRETVDFIISKKKYMRYCGRHRLTEIFLMK